jgi:hypothetical protein
LIKIIGNGAEVAAGHGVTAPSGVLINCRGCSEQPMIRADFGRGWRMVRS